MMDINHYRKVKQIQDEINKEERNKLIEGFVKNFYKEKVELKDKIKK